MREEFTARRQRRTRLFKCPVSILYSLDRRVVFALGPYLESDGGHPHTEEESPRIVDQFKPTEEVKYAETNGQRWFAPWTARVRCGGTFNRPQARGVGGRPLAGQRARCVHGTGT